MPLQEFGNHSLLDIVKTQFCACATLHFVFFILLFQFCQVEMKRDIEFFKYITFKLLYYGENSAK